MSNLVNLVIRFSNRKIGGIRFIRIGKVSMSFCVTNK